MKKLILLAVVVFGFAATSFAQTHPSPATTASIASIAIPVVVSPHFAWGPITPMAFGAIQNVKNGGTVHLSPAGGIDGATNGVTCASGTAAQFIMYHATEFPTVTVPTIYFPFSLGKLDILPSTDLTVSELSVADPSGLYPLEGKTYKVSVGGTVTLYDGATGYVNISGLTISVNNQ